MKIFTLLSVLLPIFGCSPLYYSPNAQNIPVMKEKEQLNLSVNVNTSLNTIGYEFQGAYGVTDNIALQFNAFWANSEDDAEYQSNGKGNLVEFGAGYYRKVSGNFVFETYGLIAFGKVKYEDTSEETGIHQFIETNFTRIGVQPSISYSTKHLNASLSTRFAHIGYHNINGNYPFYDNNGNYTYTTEANYLKANNSQWLAEPAITLQAGFKQVKLQAQYVISYNLGDSYFRNNYQEWDMFSLGITVQIPARKKTIEPQKNQSNQKNSP